MEVKRYQNELCSFNAELLKRDEYTFSVLSRILKERCTLILTDHNRIMICYSATPFPVWVWLPDDTTEEELRYTWRLLNDNFKGGEYRFNMKCRHAEFFMQCAKEENIKSSITMNMLTYNCETLIQPQKANGFCKMAKQEDLDIVTDMLFHFHEDIAIDQASKEIMKEQARWLIEDGKMFLWIDEEPTAMCAYRLDDEKACISHVYTRPCKRRKGYAANLVFEVTKLVKELGKMPLLYTNADYEASNSCYIGIGFKLTGSLCTLEWSSDIL